MAPPPYFRMLTLHARLPGLYRTVPGLSYPQTRETCFQGAKLVVPLGFEPKLTGPEPVVLPLHHGTKNGGTSRIETCTLRLTWRLSN